MDFHHLEYWQQRAQALKIENRLFINGRYLPAAEGETFSIQDPAGVRELVQMARGSHIDIDLAVKAAREVFERGDWSQASPAKRKATLFKLANLMEEHSEQLALLETLDTGKPIRHSLRDDIQGRSAVSAGMPKPSTRCMAKLPQPAMMRSPSSSGSPSAWWVPSCRGTFRCC